MKKNWNVSLHVTTENPIWSRRTNPGERLENERERGFGRLTVWNEWIIEKKNQNLSLEYTKKKIVDNLTSSSFFHSCCDMTGVIDGHTTPLSSSNQKNVFRFHYFPRVFNGENASLSKRSPTIMRVEHGNNQWRHSMILQYNADEGQSSLCYRGVSLRSKWVYAPMYIHIYLKKKKEWPVGFLLACSHWVKDVSSRF